MSNEELMRELDEMAKAGAPPLKIAAKQRAFTCPVCSLRPCPCCEGVEQAALRRVREALRENSQAIVEGAVDFDEWFGKGGRFAIEEDE